MQNDTVCFACGTEFHLLISYILSTTTYSSVKKILILDKNPRLIQYFDNVYDINLWDEIYIIDSTKSTSENETLISKVFSELTILHYFSWGFYYLNQLFKMCQNSHKKVILTDEGIGTYIPFQRFAAWVKNHDPERKYIQDLNIENVDEIWILNPALFLDEKKLPIKLIDINSLYTLAKETPLICANLKKLFSVSSDFFFSKDIVYFRQYYSLLGYVSTDIDAFIDYQLCNLIKNDSVYVKNHPSYRKNPYIQVIPDAQIVDIPWEVFVILSHIDQTGKFTLPKIYISPTSSAMFSSNSLGASGCFIFLNKIYDLYMDYEDPTAMELIIASKKQFLNSSIYVPESWNDLITILSKALEENHLSPLNTTIERIQEAETDLLRKLQKTLFTNNKALNKTILTNEENLTAEFNLQKADLEKKIEEQDLVIDNFLEQNTLLQTKVRTMIDEYNKLSVELEVADHGNLSFEESGDIKELANALESKIRQLIENYRIANQNLNTTKAELDIAKKELVDYATSTSWQMTRPFRKMMRFVRRK
jgi:hypothetical protein